MNCLITATDTDAGKTYVTRRLLEALRASGKRVAGYKPMCCGARNDVIELQAGGEPGLEEDRINPVWMKTPAAPLVASMFENVKIDPAELVKGYQELADIYDHVLVEGVGGWEVPITQDYSFSDFAKDLKLPILLVVNNKLGALNHALLTLNAIKAKGLTCAGMIFNHQEEEQTTATVTNKGIIESLTDVPVLTDVIPDQEEIELWPFEEVFGIEA